MDSTKKLSIDHEFKELIPPLTTDEYNQLEQNIVSASKCREALITWDGVLVDGHNRYSICMKHGIDFQTDEMQFDSRDAVKLWILSNQLGRRNLTDAMRIKLATKKAEYLKAKAKENQSLAGGDKKSEESLLTKTTKAVEAPINVRKAIADEAKVSEDTVRKYNKIEKEGSPELIEQVDKGEKKIGTAYKELFDDKPNNKTRTTDNKAKAIDIDYVEIAETKEDETPFDKQLSEAENMIEIMEGVDKAEKLDDYLQLVVYLTRFTAKVERIPVAIREAETVTEHERDIYTSCIEVIKDWVVDMENALKHIDKKVEDLAVKENFPEQEIEPPTVELKTLTDPENVTAGEALLLKMELAKDSPVRPKKESSKIASLKNKLNKVEA